MTSVAHEGSIYDRINKNLEKWRQRRRRHRRWQRALKKFPIPSSIAGEIKSALDDIPFYWTPPEKQTFLAQLFIDHSLQNAIEIGVYTGGSLVPQAVAARHVKGKVIGIDPYTDEASNQVDNREILDRLDPNLLNPDRDLMHANIQALIKKHNLTGACTIVRKKSHEAISDFREAIDLLHVDGNHDYANVLQDLEDYLPLLRKGGFLVMDDIDWPTIRPIYNHISSQMRVIYAAQGWACCQKTSDTVELPRA